MQTDRIDTSALKPTPSSAPFGASCAVNCPTRPSPAAPLAESAPPSNSAALAARNQSTPVCAVPAFLMNSPMYCWVESRRCRLELPCLEMMLGCSRWRPLPSGTAPPQALSRTPCRSCGLVLPRRSPMWVPRSSCPTWPTCLKPDTSGVASPGS